MAIYKPTTTNYGTQAHYWYPARYTLVQKDGAARVMFECFTDYDARVQGLEPVARVELRISSPEPGECLWGCVYSFINGDNYDGALKDGQKYQPEEGDEIEDGTVQSA